MQGAPNIEFFAGAEALYLCLERDVRCPVHVGSSASSPRAAGGKAAVSLRDWVIALCREGDWLMVLYETRPAATAPVGLIPRRMTCLRGSAP